MQDAEIIEQWLKEFPRSERIYRLEASVFTKHVGKALSDLTSVDLNAWVDGLTGAPTTKGRKVSIVASLLTYAFRNGHITTDVSTAMKRVQIPKRPHEEFDGEVIQELLGEVRPGRDRTLVNLVYEGGLRISEVAALSFTAIGDTWVLVKGKKVPLSETLIAALWALKAEGEPDTECVFKSYRGRPFGERDARDVIHNAAVEIGREDITASWLRRARVSKGGKPPRPYNLRPAKAREIYGIVYGLSDPETKELRYIGQTRLRIDARLRTHLSDSNMRKRHKVTEWLAELKAAGLVPTASVLATAFDREELLALERHYISKARVDGVMLMNRVGFEPFVGKRNDAGQFD
jgi:integrase